MSGYYAWRKRKPAERAAQEPRLEAEVLATRRRTRESCDLERRQQHLEERGIRIGVYRIKRLRKKLGLHCKRKRRFKATANSTDESRLYPAGLKDLYSGEIVGYAMSEPMTKYRVMQACFAPSQLGDRRRA